MKKHRKKYSGVLLVSLGCLLTLIFGLTPSAGSASVPEVRLAEVVGTITFVTPVPWDSQRTPNPVAAISTLAPTATPVPATATPAPLTATPAVTTKAATATTTAVPSAGGLDWYDFSYNPKTSEHWNFQTDPADKLRFTITPKDSNAGEPKKILLLFTKKSLTYDIGVAKILEVFYAKKIAATVMAINFEKKDGPGKAALDYARKEKFDLIFSMGSDSTDFVTKNFQNETTPVVSVGSKDPVLLKQVESYDKGSGTNFAYTSLNMPIRVQMEYLKQLKKDLKNVAVIYEDSNTSAKDTQVAPLKQIAGEYGLNIVDVVVKNDKNPRPDLEAAIPAAVNQMAQSDPGHQNSIFWITGSSSVFDQVDTINRLSGGVPVLSAVPDVVREGDNSALLSIGVSFESNAFVAAVYATDILQNKAKPGDLKVGLVSPPDIAINFRKAQQLGLKIPFSFFEQASSIFDYDGKPVRKNGQNVS